MAIKQSEKVFKPRTPPANVPKSIQYDLFTKYFGDAQDLSNTIELWDAIPKYSVTPRTQNKLRDAKTLTLPVHEQIFEYRPTLANGNAPITCTVAIKPASIKNKEGKYVQYYPSTDEEIIEEVLKKIFNDQQYGIHLVRPAESWVKFSLYMVQEELKKRGKSRSIDEIKHSLLVLSGTNFDIKILGPNKSLSHSTSVLQDLTTVSRSDYLDDPKAMWSARLPSLISRSINEVTYRQFNYGTLMELKSQLARWFFKRLTHQYTNASILSPYNILYSSIKRDSALLTHARTVRNIETLDNTLEDLQTRKVILAFKKQVRWDGNKIEDVLYILTPAPGFVSEIKAANARLREHEKLLATSTK